MEEFDTLVILYPVFFWFAIGFSSFYPIQHFENITSPTNISKLKNMLASVIMIGKKLHFIPGLRACVT